MVGAASGSHSKLQRYPKAGISWIASEEPFFPFKQAISLFRLRAAIGTAGTQPDASDKIRHFLASARPVDGVSGPTVVQVNRFGNPDLHPERTREIDGGVDLELLRGRLTLAFSRFEKKTYDAIVDLVTAPSVGTPTPLKANVGLVRNAGFDLSGTVNLVRTAPCDWSMWASVSRVDNRVVRLAPGQHELIVSTVSATSTTRIVEGYPLFSRWVVPIAGYADLNHDGILTANEVHLGDSAVYAGQEYPKYTVSFSHAVRLLRGALGLHGMFAYQAGLTQYNAAAQNQLLQGPVEEHPSLAAQAPSVVAQSTDVGLLQTVNTLRFQSFAMDYQIPAAWARRLRAKAGRLALMGSNLGLWTNYRGKDPGVTGSGYGDEIIDTGAPPIPRSWTLQVSLFGSF